MTHYKPGYVVLIPFPFTDFSTFKQRPAVVISSSSFSRGSSDIIIAAISSNLVKKKDKYEYHLNRNEQKSSGLPKPSAVKLGKIITIDKRLVRKRTGHLPQKTTKDIIDKIQSIIKIP
jgi:mRNA interferase MazF